MSPDEIMSEVRQEFERRKFAPGLLIALIRFLRELDALNGKYKSLSEFYGDFPLQANTSRGGRSNTLIVQRELPDGSISTLSIRGFYNNVEVYFRAVMKRFDYPNSAPHATQAWVNYLHWLEALLQLSEKDASSLEKKAVQFVLEKLPDHQINLGELSPIRQRFSSVLANFDFTAQRGEPRGGAFQGIVYAYIRADTPHLHLDIAKVGAGSKRLSRVGDIDGWQGERLILTVEVKHLHVDSEIFSEMAGFVHEVKKRGALGIVAGISFDAETREQLQSEGIKAINCDLLRRARNTFR